MRNGASPGEAAQSAADRMAMYFPENNAAVIVANTAGEIGSWLIVLITNLRANAKK